MTSLLAVMTLGVSVSLGPQWKCVTPFNIGLYPWFGYIAKTKAKQNTKPERKRERQTDRQIDRQTDRQTDIIFGANVIILMNILHTIILHNHI